MIKKFLNIVTVLLMICVVVSLAGDFISIMLSELVGLSIPPGEAQSIGVIGGADGPTAIFVTASKARLWPIILKFLLAITCICRFKRSRNKKKGEE